MKELTRQKCIGTVARAWADTTDSLFTDSLAQMLLYSQKYLCGPDEFIGYIKATASYHELMRNGFVKDTLGDWLLMLDTDHQFLPDLLERMLLLRAKYKTRVLSGIYAFKGSPYTPVANVWQPDGGIGPLLQWHKDKEIIPIGPCGAGCLLVDRDVFLEIEWKLKEEPFSFRQGLSEDYAFFKRCKELDIPTYLAVNVQAHHLTQRQPIDIMMPPIGWPKNETILELDAAPKPTPAAPAHASVPSERGDPEC